MVWWCGVWWERENGNCCSNVPVDEDARHIRLVSESGDYLCDVYAYGDDPISAIHEIAQTKGVDLVDQTLKYNNRRLNMKQTLDECCIPNDAIVSVCEFKYVHEEAENPHAMGIRAVLLGLVHEKFELVQRGRQITYRSKIIL
jgi:hypothetical protein